MVALGANDLRGVSVECMILCGGFGTRMHGENAQVLKPMMKLFDRPILAWIIDELCKKGVSKVILLGGYLSEQLSDIHLFRSGSWAGVEIVLAISDPQDQTCGRICAGLAFVEGEYVALTYGDSLVLYEPQAEPFSIDGDVEMSITVSKRKLDYGVIDDASIDKPVFVEKPTYLANAGNYFVPVSGIRGACDDSGASFEKVILPKLIARSKVILVHAAAWVPMDRPQDLKKGESCLKAYGRA